MIENEGSEKEGTLATIKLVGLLAGWLVAVVSITFSVILWIQGSGENKYYPKLLGENLEKQVAEQSKKLDSIETQNNTIIGTLGELRGIVLDSSGRYR